MVSSEICKSEVQEGKCKRRGGSPRLGNGGAGGAGGSGVPGADVGAGARGKRAGEGALYQATTRRPAITDRSTLELLFAASSIIQSLENCLFLGMYLQQ